MILYGAVVHACAIKPMYCNFGDDYDVSGPLMINGKEYDYLAKADMRRRDNPNALTFQYVEIYGPHPWLPAYYHAPECNHVFTEVVHSKPHESGARYVPIGFRASCAHWPATDIKPKRDAGRVGQSTRMFFGPFPWND